MMHVGVGHMPEGLIEREIKEFIENERPRKLRIMVRTRRHFTSVRGDERQVVGDYIRDLNGAGAGLTASLPGFTGSIPIRQSTRIDSVRQERSTLTCVSRRVTP